MRITAFLLLFAFVGCASVKVESFDRQGEDHAPVAAESVKIFADESAVERPFRRIGALHWHAKNPETADVHAALKEEAARIGADGVIKMRGATVVKGPYFWPIRHATGFAEAIRFAD